MCTYEPTPTVRGNGTACLRTSMHEHIGIDTFLVWILGPSLMHFRLGSIIIDGHHNALLIEGLIRMNLYLIILDSHFHRSRVVFYLRDKHFERPDGAHR